MNDNPKLRESTMSKAFTLIDLLIVLAIVAILTAVEVPNFVDAHHKASFARVKADLRTLATAIESHTADHCGQPLDYNVDRGDPPLTAGGGRTARYSSSRLLSSGESACRAHDADRLCDKLMDSRSIYGGQILCRSLY